MTIKYYLIALIISILSSLHSQADTLNVAVAANFKKTLEVIKVEFEKNSQHHLNIITASTGQLIQQISQGAPYDVLLAANTSHPQILWQQIHNSRNLSLDALYTYALGRLVFYSHVPLKPTDTLSQLLKSDHYSRISIANPLLAPYGLAAKETLKCLGLESQWKNKLVVGQNIAQAFQFIDSQSINAGFVAMSQVLNKDGNHILIVDESCYPPIKQTALRLNNKKSSISFIKFLKNEKIKDIIKLNGYLLPN